MKTTMSRVHRNGAKKTLPTQAAIAEPGIDGGGYGGFTPINLTFFDSEHDATLAGCDITAAEWRQLKEVASRRKISVGALLKDAIRSAMNFEAQSDCLMKLEDVKNDAVSVIRVLSHEFSDLEQRAIAFGYADGETVGIARWADATKKSLENHFEHCWNVLHPGRTTA